MCSHLSFSFIRFFWERRSFFALEIWAIECTVVSNILIKFCSLKTLFVIMTIALVIIKVIPGSDHDYELVCMTKTGLQQFQSGEINNPETYPKFGAY